MKPKPQARGGAWGTGVIFILVSVACLATGFMAGKVYMEGQRGQGAPVVLIGDSGAHVGGVDPDTPSVLGGSAPFPWATAKAYAKADAGRKVIGGELEPVCLDTCTTANNGVCDDGRLDTRDPVSAQLRGAFVLCDLGTDCKDCGAWQPTAVPHWTAESRGGPIELLTGKDIEVRLRKTGFSIDGAPAFMFAYTDPTKDVDVSSNMEARHAVEYGITQVFYKIFQAGCKRPDGSRGLFLDVGSNFGWFAILAARMGCRVIAYEPVPQFRAFLEYNVHVNGFEHLVEVRKNVVSHNHGVDMKMVVPSGGIWGTAGIDGLNIDIGASKTVEEIQVASVSLDNVIKEAVLLMKVDVEGWEWSVMKGAEAMLITYAVDHIIMEYSPGVPERNHKMEELAATVKMLQDILARGYRVVNIEDKDLADNPPLDATLLPMEEVTKDNLAYDAHDVELVSQGKLGCPFPGEWKGRTCGASTPEDLSPRSLRSMFGHNTNLWAAKSPGLQVVQGRVGLIDIEDPKDKFFITRKFKQGGEYDLMGMGWRRCRDMAPQWQVRHRCPCSDPAVCGEEEAMIAAWAAEGKLAMNYQL